MARQKQQAIVIGLGQFGTSVARALASRGVEVLAIDSVEEKVQAVSADVAEAMCFDATDLEAVTRLSPEKRDVCVCAIGDEAKDASIICTALLRQAGAPRVIARANDEVHARILKLVGAHQVVNPERAFGERFASQIVHEGIKGEMQLGEGVLLTEVETPEPFLGRSLGELRLPSRFGVTVVAIRKHGTGAVVLPDAETTLAEGDAIVLVAREGAVAKMMGKT
ncbi:MAG: TrkA family potassium uptake protein [Planctomycetes bacterium]|nr:TrkA family potassium uptake protein [Planctomycetota bacterium]